MPNLGPYFGVTRINLHYPGQGSVFEYIVTTLFDFERLGNGMIVSTLRGIELMVSTLNVSGDWIGVLYARGELYFSGLLAPTLGLLSGLLYNGSVAALAGCAFWHTNRLFRELLLYIRRRFSDYPGMAVLLAMYWVNYWASFGTRVLAEIEQGVFQTMALRVNLSNNSIDYDPGVMGTAGDYIYPSIVFNPHTFSDIQATAAIVGTGILLHIVAIMHYLFYGLATFLMDAAFRPVTQLVIFAPLIIYTLLADYAPLIVTGVRRKVSELSSSEPRTTSRLGKVTYLVRRLQTYFSERVLGLPIALAGRFTRLLGFVVNRTSAYLASLRGYQIKNQSERLISMPPSDTVLSPRQRRLRDKGPFYKRVYWAIIKLARLIMMIFDYRGDPKYYYAPSTILFRLIIALAILHVAYNFGTVTLLYFTALLASTLVALRQPVLVQGFTIEVISGALIPGTYESLALFRSQVAGAGISRQLGLNFRVADAEYWRPIIGELVGPDYLEEGIIYDYLHSRVVPYGFARSILYNNQVNAYQVPHSGLMTGPDVLNLFNSTTPFLAVPLMSDLSVDTFTSSRSYAIDFLIG